MGDAQPTTAGSTTRPALNGRTITVVDLPSARNRRLIVLAMLALAASVFAIAVVVTRSNPGSTPLPTAIQRVDPEPGSNVLSQSAIVVDLAVGHTAEIEVNGQPVPGEQLFIVDALESADLPACPWRRRREPASRPELCPGDLLADRHRTRRPAGLQLVLQRQLSRSSGGSRRTIRTVPIPSTRVLLAVVLSRSFDRVGELTPTGEARPSRAGTQSPPRRGPARRAPRPW